MHFSPILLFLLLFCPSFVIADFSGDAISLSSDVTLLGDASVVDGRISLTNPTNTNSSTGRVLFSNPIPFLHSLNHESASFSTRFTFSIIPSPSFGDGFAFLLTSSPAFVGFSSNGFLGLFGPRPNCTDDTITIAVEFDTNLDASLRDLDDNHVAFDVCSIFSSASASAIMSNLDLKTGAPMTAWVKYNSSENSLTVWLSYSSLNQPAQPILISSINLTGLVREFMYVGFSASNGPSTGTALHLIDNWTFESAFGFDSSSTTNSLSTPFIPPVASLDNGDRFIEFRPNIDSSKEISSSSSQGKRRRLVGQISGSISAIILFLICTTIIYLRWPPPSMPNWFGSRESRELEDEIQIEQELGRIPGRISMQEIKLATSGFNKRNILGRGSSATVYEGRLQSGSKIAVKRFSQTGHLTHTFASELGATIASCHHRNLVPLTGWCRHNEELILVYEYMPNGSLHEALHLPRRQTLTWSIRYNILKGVATGLEFLHNRCDRRILHRDVKACNVLLDENMNARLGDLGFAHLSSHGRDPQPTQVVGTPGYMAPEYMLTGMATAEADVYSFGVLVLEVATGRRPIGQGRQMALVDWVWSIRGRSRMVEARDLRLGENFDQGELVRVLLVGLACSYPDCNLRPTMRRALRMLEGTTPPPSLPLRKPEFRMPVHMLEVETSREVSTSYHSCN